MDEDEIAEGVTVDWTALIDGVEAAPTDINLDEVIDMVDAASTPSINFDEPLNLTTPALHGPASPPFEILVETATVPFPTQIRVERETPIASPELYRPGSPWTDDERETPSPDLYATASPMGTVGFNDVMWPDVMELLETPPPAYDELFNDDYIRDLQMEYFANAQQQQHEQQQQSVQLQSETISVNLTVILSVSYSINE